MLSVRVRAAQRTQGVGESFYKAWKRLYGTRPNGHAYRYVRESWNANDLQWSETDIPVKKGVKKAKNTFKIVPLVAAFTVPAVPAG